MRQVRREMCRIEVVKAGLELDVRLLQKEKTVKSPEDV